MRGESRPPRRVSGSFADLTWPLTARYHSRMAYMTFQQVADMVGGTKRLTGSDTEPGVMVGGAADTEEAHPIFDMHAAVADREVDVALKRGGYETPLVALTDAKLRNAWLGIFIGLVSQSSSAREDWMKDLEKAGRADLAALSAGEFVVIGAVEEDTSEQANEAIFGQHEAFADFDQSDPFSGMNRVYSNLGGGRTRY